jgi:Cdc6-like AAA superfamily ATPase
MKGYIFINPAVLDLTFLPRLLLYRENEHQYLAECIKPMFEGRAGTNLIITGPPGIGKTACVRFILRKLLEETDDIMTIYINCWKRDTTPKIVKEIANKLGIKLIDKMSSDEIFDLIITKFSKYKGVAFAFDEIDRVQDYDFLYRIIEDVPLKTIFMVTNVSEWIAKVDRRLMSRLMLEKQEFKPYKFEEVRGILREREKYAFKPNTWVYEAFEMIIKKCYELKDIRVGLFLMKRAAEIAENRAANKIEVKDVEKTIQKIKDFYDKQTISSFI